MLTWPRSSSSTRTPATAPTPRRSSISCCFLSFSVFVVGVALSLSLSLSLFSLSLSLFRVGRPCLQAYIREHTGVAYQTAPPIIITIVFLASFWGKSIGQRPGQSVLSCRCSPHSLPQSPKVGAGRGNGGGNRIVTQMRSLGLGQVRSHICSLALPFVEGGNAVRFSLLCLFRSGSCPLPFFGQSSLLLRAGFCENFSGANFCFRFPFWVLLFLIGICLWFSRIFSQFRPGSALKKFY